MEVPDVYWDTLPKVNQHFVVEEIYKEGNCIMFDNDCKLHF